MLNKNQPIDHIEYVTEVMSQKPMLLKTETTESLKYLEIIPNNNCWNNFNYVIFKINFQSYVAKHMVNLKYNVQLKISCHFLWNVIYNVKNVRYHQITWNYDL